ncbi:MAG: sulfide/dihydroorotate dehydrogenase-like FAD/NAD-binding protein [Clostridia bacterium]
MYEIIKKRILAENVNEYTFLAPLVAKHAKAGQFIILRVDEDGERVPFTICDMDKEAGTITLLIQTVGATTMQLAEMGEGDYIADFVGPLGNATDLSAYKKVLLVGGGIGSAVVFPQARYLESIGNKADSIIGARNKDLVMYEEEFTAHCTNFYIMTDDGTYGEKGFVTTKIKDLLDGGAKYDCIFAVGPLPMMRAVCNLTREYGVKTIVSMNCIMVDGTGMCGGCRLTVGGEVKYACVDGPEFDGHLIDFDEAMNRSRFYKEEEQEHVCRLTGRKHGGK